MADDLPVDSFSRDCPDCGAVVAADATRCPDCGASLDGEPASGPADAGEQFSTVGRDLETDLRDAAAGDGAGGGTDDADGTDVADGVGGTDVGGGVDAGRAGATGRTGVDSPDAADSTDAADSPDAAGRAGADRATWAGFVVAAGAVVYLHVSYALVLFPSTAAVARSDPVLLADAAAFVTLPLATLFDATRVRAAGTWSPRRWVWIPLVAVPVLNLLTAPVYLVVRLWRA